MHRQEAIARLREVQQPEYLKAREAIIKAVTKAVEAGEDTFSFRHGTSSGDHRITMRALDDLGYTNWSRAPSVGLGQMFTVRSD